MGKYENFYNFNLYAVIMLCLSPFRPFRLRRIPGLNATYLYDFSYDTRCAHNNVAAVTSQTNKRHIAAVKQLILILLVYVISFVPLLLAGNVPWTSFWIVYLIFTNNVANFFIYLAVNKDFRNETKIMINVILKKMRPGKEQTIFVLR